MLKQAVQGLKHRLSIGFMMMVACLSVAGSAFAAEGDVTVDTTQVTGTFSSMTTTVMTVIGAVAAAAVTVMGVILAWKYGRKLFGMLAK